MKKLHIMIKNVHKTILAFATLVLCLFAFTAQAQFSGEGFYRITNYNEVDYMSWLAPSSNASTQSFKSQSTTTSGGTDNTIFRIVETVPAVPASNGNPEVPAIYNIRSNDGKRVVERFYDQTNVRTRPTTGSTDYNNIENTNFTIEFSSNKTTYKGGLIPAPYTTGETYSISNFSVSLIVDAMGNFPSDTKYIQDRANFIDIRSSDAIDDKCRWYFTPVPVPANGFIGNGQYRVTLAEDNTKRMTFIGGDPSVDVTTNTDNSTLLTITEHQSTGKYNIISKDGDRFLTIDGNNVVAKQEVQGFSINDPQSRFAFTRESSNSYSISTTYDDGSGEITKFLYEQSDDVKGNPDTSVLADDSKKWVLEYVEPTASVDEINTQKALKAYPNPSSDGSFTLDKASEWSVYSITGALISNGNGTKIDISSAPKGMYILRSNGIATKLVIQ